MEEFPKVRKPYGSKLISIRIYEDMTDHHISVETAELLCERLRAVLEAQRLQVSDGEILAFSGTVDEKVLFSSLAGEHPDPVPESVLEVDILESQAKINAFVSGKIDEIQTRIKRIDAKQGAMDEAAVCLKLLKRHSRWAHGENQMFLKRMSALEEKAGPEHLGTIIRVSDSLPGSGGGCGDCDMCRHGNHCDDDCDDDCVDASSFVCDASKCEECKHASIHHGACKTGAVCVFERVGDTDGRRCIIYKHEYDDECDSYIGIRSCNVDVGAWYTHVEDARKFANERDAVAYAREMGVIDDVSFRFVHAKP